jgi:light-regulated signal transduction histidine kinase (bacteriophytochrome)
LTYSKVGRGDTSVERTDLSLLIKQLLIDLESLIQESGAIVTYDDLPSITANPTEMTQLFQNLVGNAIKFHGKERPEIHISAARGEKEWTFSVCDNGIGIDPPSIGRIFQLFQRLHTKQEYPGTGIGLAVCKKVVERRGGRIWAESEPGKGSAFYFTLPIVGKGSSGENGASEILLTEHQSGDAGETVKHLEEVER